MSLLCVHYADKAIEIAGYIRMNVQEVSSEKSEAYAEKRTNVDHRR